MISENEKDLKWESAARMPTREDQFLYSDHLDEYFRTPEDIEEKIIDYYEFMTDYQVEIDIYDIPYLTIARDLRVYLCEPIRPVFRIENLFEDILYEDADLPNGAWEIEDKVNTWIENIPEDQLGWEPKKVAWNGEWE